MSQAFILALLPTIIFSFMLLLASKATKHSGALKSLFLFQFLGLPFFILLIPFMPHVAQLHLEQPILIGVFYTFVFLLYFYAMRIGNLSVVAPISELSVIVTIFLSIIFLHESFGVSKSIGTILLLVGVVSVGFHIQKNKSVKLLAGVPQVLFSTIGTGTYFFLVSITARENGWFWTAFLIRVAIAAVSYMLLVVRKEHKDVFQHVPWKILIAASFLDVIGFSLYNFAVSTLEVSYVSLIVSSQALFIALFSYIFLKEKLRPYQLVGIMLIVGGLIALELQ